MIYSSWEKIRYMKNLVLEKILFHFLRIKMRKSQVKEKTVNFIISPGRSGTTFLRKEILNSSNIHIPPESGDFIIHLAKKYAISTNLKDYLHWVIKEFENQGLNKFWRLEINGLRKHLTQSVISWETALNDTVFELYNYHRMVKNPDAVILVDKSPYLSLRLKWLSLIFPNSKYLFLIREPHATISSRISSFNESFDLAVKKWIWAVKEYSKFRNFLNWRLCFYEDLLGAKDENLNSVIKFFAGERKITETPIELGDDNLAHHKNLFKKKILRRENTLNDLEKRKISDMLKEISEPEILSYYNF